MKKRIFTITILLLFVVVSTVYAASNTQITAQLNNSLKFVLNGKAWTPPSAPISYKGTTYLPVRAVAEATGSKVGYNSATQTITIDKASESYDAVLEFPANKYPQTAAHIASAIMAGESAICTIDRAGADVNRDAALAGIPTKDGYDRDEWPMAVCKEGGAGADVAYVEASDNRGAGAFIGNALEKYKDGTRVRIVIVYAQAKPQSSTQNPSSSGQEVVYASCAEAKAAGAAPLRKGDPGYSAKLDRDGDGIACEN